MIIGDVLIATALQHGLDALRGNEVLMDDLFRGVPEELEGQVRRWFADPRNAIDIRQNYPAQAPRAPVLAIVLAEEEEVDQGIGQAVAQEHLPSNAHPIEYDLVEGTWFNATWRIVVLTAHPTLTIALHAFAKWALLLERQQLHHWGLVAQSLTGGDLEPAPEWLPDYVFSRAVILRAQYLADTTQRFPVQVTREVDVHLHVPESYLTGVP